MTGAAGERLSIALADRYRIERELGAGGMATVYLAHDLKHDRKVAIKVLRPDLAATLGAERFLREIRIAAALQHPHIVPLHDSGEVEGHLFYVMPHVEGQSLRQKLLREGELPVSDAVRIIRDVTDALTAAHAAGVVHRDLKPENVMLSGRHALVTDFGVAKAVSESTGRQVLTTLGVALGTPTYMSPEQATADPHVDHRADIYALGVIAYELLAGRPPFTGGTPQQVLAAHVTEAAEPVSKHRKALPPALSTLVMKCLEKRPADRWQSADELIMQLDTVLTPTGGVTPTETQPHAALGRAIPAWARAVAAVVLLGAILGGVLLFTRGRAGDAAAGKGPTSLAVLTFELLAQDSALAYLSQGISEDVSSALGQMTTNRVKSPSVVRRAEATGGRDLAALGKTLEVKYLVEGSMRRLGEAIRVTVRLVDPTSAEQRWANTYDRAPATIPTLATDIARDLGAPLGAGTAQPAVVRSASSATRNPVAYDAYLRGNFFYAQRRADATRNALANYEEAARLDPTFAAARARVGMALAQIVDNGSIAATETRASLLRRSGAAVDSALALDSTLAEGWVARAYVLMGADTGTLTLARRAAERAVQLDPASVEAHNRLGWLLISYREFAAAATEARQALALDPGFHQAHRILAGLAVAEGRLDAAAAHLDSTLQLAPWFGGAKWELAQVEAVRGRHAEARRLADAWLQQVRASDPWLLAYVEAKAARPAAARAWLARHPRDSTIGVPVLLSAIGDRAGAVRAVRLGAAFLRLLGVSALLRTPEFVSLRSDPEWKAVVAERLARATAPR